MRRRVLLPITLATMLVMSSGLHAQVASDIVVVMAASAPELRLTREQVADVFLGRALTLPDGRRPVPVDQHESSAHRAAFYEAYAGKSAAQVKAHWSKIIFTGRGKPPRQVADDAAAKKLLVRSPNAIVYIDRAAVDAAVRIVSEL